MRRSMRGRRDFLRASLQVAGVMSLSPAAGTSREPTNPTPASEVADPRAFSRPYNGPYEARYLDQIAFPLGGMGAGMICLEGTGALSKFSLHHHPDLASEPRVFAALSLPGTAHDARVLEGPVPSWKLRPQFPGAHAGIEVTARGLPRFRHARFESRFPFARIHLDDRDLPLEVTLTGWSPFSPGDADNASLPMACLEYEFVNRSASFVEAVFSFHAENFLAKPKGLVDLFAADASPDRIRSTEGGFILYGTGPASHPWDEAYWAAWVDSPAVKVNHAWFRGGIFAAAESLERVWQDIRSGGCYARDPLDSSSPGASLFVPLALAPGQRQQITVNLAWYVPQSNLFQPPFVFKDGKPATATPPHDKYQPWYAGRFSDIGAVIRYWRDHARVLRQAAERFSAAFYDSTLPPEVIEAVASNLTILKSSTVLRQTDGRLWAWEGSYDSAGSSYGSCTHVWNYAQAIAHLFPDLERGLRETELGPNQSEAGYQSHRSALPIRPIADTDEGHVFPAAADGQLSGILNVYRDWRISGDTTWLRRLWPKVRASLDYCIRTWDPEHRGWLEEPHLNTYDVFFWGPDSRCTSLYLGALKAAVLMGTALHEPVRSYAELLCQGVRRTEGGLFDGEYFFQKIEWQHLHTAFPMSGPWSALSSSPSPEGLELAQREGPSGQYGHGCLSDGLLGEWLVWMCGIGNVLPKSKIENHLEAVHRHNLKVDLTDHAVIRGAVSGTGAESGLVVCTWPKGDEPTLPLPYASEVWTGIEYQVASHLISLGKREEGLQIVRLCRDRYDGRVRNPFAEVEAGQWYARALSSYALLQAFSGARFDAVEKVLYLNPPVKGDFRCFFSTATGYGTVGVRDGRPFCEVVSGQIPYTKIAYAASNQT